jgi:hypothetical protein
MANHNAMMINEQQMTRLGVELAGFAATSTSMESEQFRAWYGVHPTTATDVFQKMQPLTDDDVTIEKPNPFYFLMTLYWMHSYHNECLMCGMFKIKSKKTFLKNAWMSLKAIQSLKQTEVSNMMQWKY